MTQKTELINNQKIAYIRRTGAYGPENQQTIEAIKQFRRENALDNATIYAIAWDDPTRTDPSKCRYDACCTLDESFDTSTVEMAYLPSGHYIICEISHTEEGLMAFWQSDFPGLMASGLSLDNTRPILERYQATKVANHLCEMCIPIIK